MTSDTRLRRRYTNRLKHTRRQLIAAQAQVTRLAATERELIAQLAQLPPEPERPSE